MPYRFERIDTATTPVQLSALLPLMERRQYDITQYIAVRCYETSAGPPMSRGKAAPWYDDFNPDQLYLPFEGFQPVEVQSIYNNFSPEMGDGWVISHTRHGSRRHRDISFHERQTFAPNRILSLSVFKRVQVDGGAPRPFVRASVDSPAFRSTQRTGGAPSPASQEPIALAMQSGVRDILAANVGSLVAINEDVVMDEGGMFHTRTTGRAVARLIRADVSADHGYIEFTLEVRGHQSIASIRVAYREAVQSSIRW